MKKHEAYAEKFKEYMNDCWVLMKNWLGDGLFLREGFFLDQEGHFSSQHEEKIKRLSLKLSCAYPNPELQYQSLKVQKL